MNNNSIPIIFIHQGDSNTINGIGNYLPYTIRMAQKFNQDKEVILLGDKDNVHYKSFGIKHEFFFKYNQKPEIQLFNQIFKYIKGGKLYTEFPGKLKNAREFERFCFARWFYLYYFMQEHDLQKCWYFDSDTLLLTKLSDQESKYQTCDCTEQCNGSCMKGLISQTALKGYIDTINRLFQDNDYLTRVKQTLDSHPDWVFCDMRAYDTYKQSSHIKTIPLFQPINNQIFDDALTQERNSEMENNKLIGQRIKKLYWRNNKPYIKNPENKQLIQLNCVNLGWLPNFFIKNICHYLEAGKATPFYKMLLPSMNYRSRNKIKYFIKRILNKIV
jgi:hypothetical protein